MPRKSVVAIAVAFLALLLNSAYLAALPSATIFYMANVLLHVLLGVGTIGGGLLLSRRLPAPVTALLGISAVFGIYLIYQGNLLAQRWALWAHIAVAAFGLAVLLAYLPRLARASAGWRTFQRPYAALCALLVIAPALALAYHRYFPNPADRIRNPLIVPASMEHEGGGPQSPFWPSSSQTNVQAHVPSNFFLDSAQCGECHQDVYKQWNSSVHHNASFNNQFYRKSIEYMQAVQGNTKQSQWCAACHDHAVLFSGRWQKPIKDQIDTPEAQAGLACVSCHAISRVDSSMGNAGFTMEYNALHDLAASKNRYVQALDRFLTYVNPEPHRRTFLKPFMRQDSAEYCSTCHKVHLDQPVNNYRWVRGFNDYDNWQASGVSGQGARSFYYPPKPQTCTDCHMPLVASHDPGNKNGKVHSHRFPGANTAIPYVNNDEAQLKETERFLKSGILSVDIFSVSPVTSTGLEMKRRATAEAPAANSTFAVGEEAEQTGQTFLREVGQLAAPLNHTDTTFRPGSTVRVDVVVRTRKVGHFFPGGTVDSHEVWLELQGKDADGRVVFWSGQAADDGRGAVEPGAHFYRSYQLDAAGNYINKRNAWQSRSLLYVRLIPPGAADVAHYRVQIPKNARGPITLTAKLNYRKFTPAYTAFSYAGEPKPGQDPSLVSINHDSREWSFDEANIPANISGARKGELPNLPTTVIAQATSKLNIGETQEITRWQPVLRKEDRERWNDWGIGLLLQGDLKGAEYAFLRVTEAEPAYSDGWLNVARALIQEGETERAKPYLQKAIALNPQAGRNYYFLALTQKTDGDYDAALQSLQRVTNQYPKDRVVLNQTGRILFLKRDYPAAVQAFQRVLAVDPEDVQAHYNLMLCYRGLGQRDLAAREEVLFRRFKADESSQSITAKPRQLSPELNNSRQPIHDHESIDLAPAARPKSSASSGRVLSTLRAILPRP